MITFDTHGRPVFVPRTGAFMHVLDAYRSKAATLTPPFTQADKDWFRKPLARMGEGG
jgi:hypothetical protein